MPKRGRTTLLEPPTSSVSRFVKDHCRQYLIEPSVIALALNKSAYNAILFRPRVMNDVDIVDTRTNFLGYPTSLPIFVAPAGMAKLRWVGR